VFGFDPKNGGFEELDAEKNESTQCTKGIWMKLDKEKKTMIFDIEGGDSQQRKDRKTVSKILLIICRNSSQLLLASAW